MKTLWTYSALVLATLYHGSLQCKPCQTPSLRSPKILVVGGDATEMKTELWPDSECTMPEVPLAFLFAVGFWTVQGPTVCGGIGGGKTCLIYKDHHHQWMPWTDMGTSRYGASALQIDPNHALIIGGADENGYPLKTTELISSTGTKKGIDFPVTIGHHCSFKINATHGLVTGGWQDGSRSRSTWFVDLTWTTPTVTPGPTMKTRRAYHGCSIFKHGTKTFGIVSGGGRGLYWTNATNVQLNSTEIIDFDQESPKWTEGPKLPIKLSEFTMVETTQGTYAMGGYNKDYHDRNEVLQFDCPGDQIQSCQWKEVGNLQFGRFGHVAITLP